MNERQVGPNRGRARRWLIAWLIAALTATLLSPAAAAAPDPAEPPELVLEPAAPFELAAGEPIELILGVEPGADTADLVAEVEAAGGTVTAVHDGALSVELDPGDTDGLRSATSVEPVVELVPMLSTARQRVRADVAHASGIRGAGRRIVIIDTGIDHTHPELSNRIVASACFVSNGSCPNGSNEQIDNSGPAAGVACTGTGCAHGTNVARAALAIAPDADLISVRIFGSNPGGGQPPANTTDLVRALDWVRSTRSTHRPDVVNLSLGTDATWATACDPAIPTVAQAMRRLRDVGIAPVAAAGNGGQSLGVSAPACVSAAVGVTATTSNDGIAGFANRGSRATLAAPGSVSVGQGTSFAAPQVAGAWALLRSRSPGISVDEAEWRMLDRGRRITDPQTGLQIRRLDVAAVLGLRSRVTPPPAPGGWVITSSGRPHARGAARSWGGMALQPGERVVAGAPTRSGVGYWMVTDRGRIGAFGDAQFHGDARTIPLNQPIIAMAATRSGNGYWLLGTDGGVFSFGDATFYGSTGGIRLNAPVTDMARTPSGRGYWLSALDGGIFSFGDAPFYGSTGGMRLNQPAVSLTPSTRGYWLVALDGGIFAFGDAPFHGSLPGIPVRETGLRIRAGADGGGYHILTREGLLARFGNAIDLGPRVPLSTGESPVDLMLLG